MRRRRLRKAELGKWDSSYPDASPKRPVKVNYPWFTDNSGRPYFAKPDPRIFDPDLVTPELQHHAMGLWEGYQTMRLTKLPGEYGLSRTGLPFEKYAVIYQKQADLSTPDMDELWHYMMGVRWVTSTAYKGWRDLLKSNELSQLRTPKWHTDRRPSPPEVTVAKTRRRKASEVMGYDSGWFETWIEPEEVEQFYKKNWSPTFEPSTWALKAMQRFGGDDPAEFEDQEEEDFFFELFLELAKKVDEANREGRRMEEPHGPRRGSGSRRRLAAQPAIERIELYLKALQNAEGQNAKELKESLNSYISLYRKDVGEDNKALDALLDEYKEVPKAASFRRRRSSSRRLAMEEEFEYKVIVTYSLDEVNEPLDDALGDLEFDGGGSTGSERDWDATFETESEAEDFLYKVLEKAKQLGMHDVEGGVVEIELEDWDE